MTNYEILLKFFEVDEQWLKRNTGVNKVDFNKMTGNEVVKLFSNWKPKDEEVNNQIKSMEQAFFAKDMGVNVHFF